MTNAIKCVEIKDFLAFRGGFGADFCPGVNVLIGGNGSGKTTLMKVVYAACEEKETDATSLESINKYLPQYFAVPAFAGESVIKIKYTNGTETRWLLKNPKIDKREASSGLVLSEGMDLTDSVSVTLRSTTVPNAVYIPEKDILEHSKGLLPFIQRKNTGFSDIYKNILIGAQDVPTKEQTTTQKSIGQKLVEIIGGYVEWVPGDGTFYMVKTDGNRIPFSIEASGFKKLGFLGLLVTSGQFEPGSVLFWDEPENSLNPELIPKLVDVLLELSRNGVQIFIATHSYDVARWFELNKTAENSLRYFNLRKTYSGIVADVADDYVSLPNSVIDDADSEMLKRVAKVAAEKAGVKLK
jgi:energy-coupling factor transporter ATP-binding protein EcfA2